MNKREREKLRHQNLNWKIHKKKYQHSHRKEQRIRRKKWALEHSEEKKARQIARRHKEGHQIYKVHKNQQHKTKREIEKAIVYDHYGRECKCCGESNMEFLSLDHIKGGGRKQRKQNGKQHLYGWIIKNNFPSDFQVLCMNCNFARGKTNNKNKICPHKYDGRKYGQFMLDF
jgi:hypothetical protein